MCAHTPAGDSGSMSIVSVIAALVAIAMVLAMAVAPFFAEAL